MLLQTVTWVCENHVDEFGNGLAEPAVRILRYELQKGLKEVYVWC